MLRAYNFNPGYRYGDYTKGDKLAGFGIAALVATTMGGKIAKATGLMLILKKLSGFIFTFLAAGFYKLRKFFKKTYSLYAPSSSGAS